MRVYCKAIIDAQPWLHDPRCLPIPWRDMPNKRKLKIGVMYHDGCVYPTPPVTRALRETVEKLKAAGHEIVDWEPTGHLEGVKLLVGCLLDIQIAILTDT
jgi:amidase